MKDHKQIVEDALGAIDAHYEGLEEYPPWGEILHGMSKKALTSLNHLIDRDVLVERLEGERMLCSEGYNLAGWETYNEALDAVLAIIKELTDGK